MTASAAIRQLRIWATDIIQAFIQSINITRAVYLKPPPEFGLHDDEVLMLVKPLYGLADAGDYWYVTLRSFIKEELGIPNTDGNVSLYFHPSEGLCDGMMVTYVDDLCAAGNDSFSTLMQRIEERFDSKARIYDEFHFAGVHINQNSDGSITLDQSTHARRITPMKKSEGFDQFR